ncbi:hypothetical protein NDU88_000553 [Pleurodeles waltl]|uniref:Uncharacterized protein n=1 Tax=Pleurodeles waltl TaxID=8319 RepID=A0AAV7RAB5_PLEWA|nr:hypothetical protein NDU88_000553 [Pleurodeles waltl]
MCCTLHDTLRPAYPQQSHPVYVLHITRHPAANIPSAVTPGACGARHTTPCGQHTTSSHTQGMCCTSHDTLRPTYPQQSHPVHVLNITRHPAASIPPAVTPRACAAHYTTPCCQHALSSHTQGMCCTLHDTLRPSYPQQSHPGHVLHVTRHPAASVPPAVTPRACAAHYMTPCGLRTPSSHTQGLCCTLNNTLRPSYPQQSHPGHVLHVTRHPAASVPSAVAPRACAARYSTPCGQHTLSSHTQDMCCTLNDTLQPAYPQQSHSGHVLHITRHPAASVPPAVTPRTCAAHYTTPCGQRTLSSHTQGMCYTLHDTLLPAYPQQSHPGHVLHITRHPAASVPSADTLRPAYPQQSHPGHVLHITRHPVASTPPAVTPRTCAAHYTTPCGQRTLSSHTQSMCCTLHGTLRPAYPQQSHPGPVLHVTRHPAASVPSAVTPRACAEHYTTPFGQHTPSSHTQALCCTLHDTLRPAYPQQSHPGHVLNITQHPAASIPPAVTPRACAAQCCQCTLTSHTQGMCCTLHDTLRPAYPEQSQPGPVVHITQHPAASVPSAVTPRACAAHYTTPCGQRTLSSHPAASVPSAVTPRACAAHYTAPCGQHTLSSHTQDMCCTLHDTLLPAYPQQSHPGHVLHITRHPAASVPSAVTPRACATHYTTPCCQRTPSSHTQDMCCTLHDTLRPAYPQQTPCGQRTLSSHTQGMCCTLHGTLWPAHPQQSHPGHVLHITQHPAASVPSAVTPRACAARYTAPCGQRTPSSRTQALCCTLHDTLRPAYPQQSHPGHVLNITQHPAASIPPAVTPRPCAAHYTTPCGQRTLSSHTQGMC